MVPWPIAMHDTWMCVQVDRRRRDCRNGRSVWPPCSWGNHDGAWVHDGVWVHEAIMADVSSWCVGSWGNHDGVWVHGAWVHEAIMAGVSSWCVSSWGNHDGAWVHGTVAQFQSIVAAWVQGSVAEAVMKISVSKPLKSCMRQSWQAWFPGVVADFEGVTRIFVSKSNWRSDEDFCIIIKLKVWRGSLYQNQIEGVTRIFVSKSKSLKSCTRQSWQCTDSGRSSLYDSYKCKYSPCGNISVMQAWWCIFPWELLCYCTYLFLSFVWRAQNETSQPFIVIQVASTKSTKPQHSDSSLCTELARTVYIISPCIWWFSYQKDRWYTVYVYMVLANPTRVLGYKCPFS